MVSLTLPLVLETTEVHLTDEQFYQLCRSNPDLSIERSAKGALIVMTPVGGEGGSYEMELGADLTLWNRQTKLGKTFSSSTLFKLPIGGGGEASASSFRSPDAAWVELSRWQALTPEQRRKFPPIAPDFVIELRSPTDDLELLRAKMQEYMDAGVRLGWMLNPQEQQVEIYRQGQPKEVRELPTELSGEDVLPGFVLPVSRFED
ncbi:Uma2 family endonuclease [Thermoleptolyngbya sp. C42_A2020_037]|uniref:Uma2 family endonuclease n=1 Tax=Thermoleptolyngbya sp. C42_A2020_037 TaxID=2747799 RepID=UPI0019F89034|nr:Uma2 family endonuclease [Thermoleptolyngbya sp. C42_A2020_037]MBF2083066.1 Uma2 family endonuclease [Thermoleptolyngbya sp. C42_A2020_037]MBF2083067.1 Uma2 family endonuclease [Thermoleptolyngbya sp. C42_A2020_037]